MGNTADLAVVQQIIEWKENTLVEKGAQTTEITGTLRSLSGAPLRI